MDDTPLIPAQESLVSCPQTTGGSDAALPKWEKLLTPSTFPVRVPFHIILGNVITEGSSGNHRDLLKLKAI